MRQSRAVEYWYVQVLTREYKNAPAQHLALTGPGSDELQRIERSPEPPGACRASLGIPILTMVGNGVIL
jgi:hypothetical protein